MMSRRPVSVCTALCVLAGSAASTALATPVINGANLHTRVFNDFPGSTLTTVNNYPNIVEFMDGPIGPGPFANRHNFRLSDNGGVTDASFANNDGFVFASDVTLLGTAPIEGGLQVSPWWSPQVDGQFNLNGGTGEVAVFGGRLPFYSFTANHGVTYAMGTTVRQQIIYRPNGLSMASPGTIVYQYTDGSGTYTSPELAFDQGNPAEDPPYGLWGILNDARVGGCVQIMNFDSGQHSGGARFENMYFIPAPGALGLIGAAGLLAARRRR